MPTSPWFIWAFAIAVYSASTFAPAHAAAPEQPAGAQTIGTKTQPAPKRHALLIGIGEATYRGIKQVPLPQCVIDAQTLAATLKPRGYSVEVIADGEKIEPMARTIRDEVAAACGLAKEGDHLLVYISTHGDWLDGKSVIIAKDDAVEIDWIKRHMAASRASVKVLMLDCCRNNKGFERTTTEARDVHCIMACRPDQLSQVGQSGMSVFTEALVDALVDCRADRVADGKIELDELLFFLDREVPARAAALQKDKPQNPTRTVVDAKVVAPVFAECTIYDQLSFGTGAFEHSAPPAARTSLALIDLMFLRLQPRMTVDEATKAVGGTWTNAPALDAKGAGLGILEGKPGDKDALIVRFEEGRVTLAHVLFTEMCREPYDPLRVRAAIEKLVGKSGEADPAKPTGEFAPGSLAALQVPLKGLRPGAIVQRLGCPEQALLPIGQFAGAIGELRYPGVPRPGQMLVVTVEKSEFASVNVVMLK